MDWDLLGRLFICSAILGGGILFIIININYTPED